LKTRAVILGSNEEHHRAACAPARVQRQSAPGGFIPDARAASLVQRQHQQWASSSSQAAQLKACAETMAGRSAGPFAQRAADADLLQGKFAVVQHMADEGLLQGNFLTVQRMDAEQSPQGALDAPRGRGNALQLKPKKNSRKEKKRQKGIAYQERHEQHLMDTLVGSNVRQQLDLANPLRSDEDRRTDMGKLAAMDDEDRTAWSKSLQANMHLQAEGYVPTLTPAPGQGYSGLTVFNDAKKEVQVRYDPDEVSYRNKDRRIGRLAASFTHELAVHGPNLDGDPDLEHGDMSSPETRDHYLDAIHRTFASLDNAKQQRAFANEWKTDIFNHLAWDDDMDENVKAERRQWAMEERRKMMAAIDQPNKFDWAQR
jgi:hypothetical protein